MGLDISLVCVKREDFEKEFKVPFDTDRKIFHMHEYYLSGMKIGDEFDDDVAYAGGWGWDVWDRLRDKYVDKFKKIYPNLPEDDFMQMCYIHVTLDEIKEIIKEDIDSLVNTISKINLNNWEESAMSVESIFGRNQYRSMDFATSIITGVSKIYKQVQDGTYLLFFEAGY